MLRICHLTSVHSRYDPRIFHKECTSLANAGYDVTLLVADGKPNEVRNGVKIMSINFRPKNRIDRILHSGAKLLDKALEIDAEIYHLHDPELLPLGKKLKKRGKRVIFDSHENVVEDIAEKQWIPVLLRRLISKFYSVYADRVLKKFDGIIGVTPVLVDKLREINRSVAMITNYPITHDTVEKHVGVKYINPTIVFAGGIKEDWCHENILNAISEINVRYVIMGPSEDKYLDRLSNNVSWSKVRYLGVVPPETVKKQLKNSHIGVAISKYLRNTSGKIGTLGNTKLFEVMMAGLPVICTNFILWQQIIDKYHCGITVNPENIDEITNAVHYLLEHPQEAKQMGENGRKGVEEEFNWSTQEKVLLEFYKRIESN